MQTDKERWKEGEKEDEERLRIGPSPWEGK